MKPAVVVMPGDGIGRIVVPEALRVLDAAGFEAELIHADLGWDCWRRDGIALPQRTIELLLEHRVGLLGAITSRPKTEAEAALPPELRGTGRVYRSPVLELRRRLSLEVALRPSRSFAGHPLNFVRRTATGLIEEPAIDTLVVMQNTECLYAGIEWSPLPAQVREAFDAHPEMARFRDTSSEDLAVSARVMSREACLRVARVAFEHAARRGDRVVRLCDKWGVMRETAALLLSAAQEVAREYPGISLECVNVDAQLMWLTRRPEDAGVVLASALVGDLLSDAFAGLAGGLGFAACANLGPSCAVFEPTHGSAPQYAERLPSIVNPIATVLAGAMLAEHVGQRECAERVRAGVAEVVARGRVRTYDMLGLRGADDVVEQGAATTRQLSDALIDAVQEARGSRARAG